MAANTSANSSTSTRTPASSSTASAARRTRSIAAPMTRQEPTGAGPNYPGSPFWVEGQAFPTGVAEADNMIQASKETYDLFRMPSAATRSTAPAPRWTPSSTAAMAARTLPGTACSSRSARALTTDDVTGHEWGHAYTQYTDDLIYAWQSGALNERYVRHLRRDRRSPEPQRRRGRKRPAHARRGVCTVHTHPPATLTVNSPPAIAGDKPAGTADGFRRPGLQPHGRCGTGQRWTAAFGGRLPTVASRRCQCGSGRRQYCPRRPRRLQFRREGGRIAQANGAAGLLIGNQRCRRASRHGRRRSDGSPIPVAVGFTGGRRGDQGQTCRPT